MHEAAAGTSDFSAKWNHEAHGLDLYPRAAATPYALRKKIIFLPGVENYCSVKFTTNV